MLGKIKDTGQRELFRVRLQAAIEPVSRHLKNEFRMEENYPGGDRVYELMRC